MPPAPADLLAALDEGVGVLAADGGIDARNDALRAMQAACGRAGAPAGDLRALGVDAADADRLRRGEAIALARSGRRWRLRCVALDGATWLLAAEETASHRAATALAELARMRLLGRSMSVLVHDFNNMLNAAIGLATTLRPLARDAGDTQLLADMIAGTQRGAQLLRSVARMLAHAPRERGHATLATIVVEAMALAEKSLLQRGVRPVVAAVPETDLRVDATECVQAVWQGILALIGLAPKSLRVEADLVDLTIGAGRPRRCARLGLVAQVADVAAAATATRLLDGATGLLAALGSPAMPAGLAAAWFLQRRVGGDLTAALVDGSVTLTYAWPARA